MSDLAQKISDRIEQAQGPDVLANVVKSVMSAHLAMPWPVQSDCHGCRRTGATRMRCLGCAYVSGNNQVWPCPTIKAIASALGVREDQAEKG